eukprot:1150183-Pelagomonas_calceolata.AAC.1
MAETKTESIIEITKGGMTKMCASPCCVCVCVCIYAVHSGAMQARLALGVVTNKGVWPHTHTYTHTHQSSRGQGERASMCVVRMRNASLLWCTTCMVPSSGSTHLSSLLKHPAMMDPHLLSYASPRSSVYFF